MRILIVGINYAPELTGIGKYTGEMSEWLAAHGHEVRVVTAPPYYPEWRVADHYSAWRYRREVRERVLIWRCPIWVPARPSGLKRILHLASFALSSLPIMMRHVFWRPDVVLTIEPPLFCAPSAWLCAKLSGAKSWLHVQDFEVDAAFELGILRTKWLRGVVSNLESWLMRRFDRVSTISPNMMRRLTKKNIPVNNQVFFQNWVDIKAIFPLKEPSKFRKLLGIENNCIVALYSGNMGEKQGLDIVLEVAILLGAQSTIRFVLCGDGAARHRLQKKYGDLPNVNWIPLQPLAQLNDLLNIADIHLLPQRAGAEDLVMPSKLIGMLASGRPVIATVSSWTQIAHVLCDCGVVVEPGEVKEFLDALIQLAQNANKRAELGKRARQFALDNWDQEYVMQALNQQLKNL